MQEEREMDIDVFEAVDGVFNDPGEEVLTLRSSPSAAPEPGPDLELPHALAYASKDGGTGNGHVVIRQANGDLSCVCWPALRSPSGCHAMKSARVLLGLPPV